MSEFLPAGPDSGGGAAAAGASVTAFRKPAARECETALARMIALHTRARRLSTFEAATAALHTFENQLALLAMEDPMAAAQLTGIAAMRIRRMAVEA